MREVVCQGIKLEMSVSECLVSVVTDGVCVRVCVRECVRVTNIGHVISHIHRTQLTSMRSRRDCRKLGWDVFM